MHSSESLLGVLNDILDFSKIEAKKLDLEPLDFDLRTTLDETMDLFALRAEEKGLEFVCVIDPEVPTLLVGDPGRLRQIVTNLLGNAIKFTSVGEVAVKVGLLNEDDNRAELRFDITDTGIGIPEDTLNTLFNAFTQADASTTRRFGGTGLGLCISKQLIQMKGGKINVESVEGEGSTFWFTVVFEKQRTEDRMQAMKDGVQSVDDGYEATREIRKRERNNSASQTRDHIPIIAMTANAMQGDRKNAWMREWTITSPNRSTRTGLSI